MFSLLDADRQPCSGKRLTKLDHVLLKTIPVTGYYSLLLSMKR